MTDVCLYFQVHQPQRLRHYRVFDIGSDADYFDHPLNRTILDKVSRKCYLPANQCLQELVQQTDGRFRFAFSLSGVFIEQLLQHAPQVLTSFQRLVQTQSVELLGETYCHSLASLADEAEFVRQVAQHRETLAQVFQVTPRVFRNTELIYSDQLAPLIQRLGFVGTLAEGVERVLSWRSPNYVYEAVSAAGLKLLLRNYPLSDDVGFRFSQRSWREWPLTADKFVRWIAQSPGECVNLFLDFETFGEHQWAETGIFDFLRHFVLEALRCGIHFVHPSTLAQRPARDRLSFSTPTSWADLERDVSAWLGNGLQQAAHQRLYALRGQVQRAGDARLLQAWQRLSTSDHFYYMCTKWFSDGDVHKYFSPYESPYDAFIAFMNVMQDLEQRLAHGRVLAHSTEAEGALTR